MLLRNRSRGYRLDTLLLIPGELRQWQPMSWVKDRTVPTIILGVLYCSFVISCGRRRILHLNITKHPDPPVGRATAARIVPV
jgi:hypothetical protein